MTRHSRESIQGPETITMGSSSLHSATKSGVEEGKSEEITPNERRQKLISEVENKQDIQELAEDQV